MDADDEDCPLCCEAYKTQGAQFGRSRVTCSATDGCHTFSMCRLCIYRQSVQLERPFVVDDDTGDFVKLDPTVCPQCKRPGAFQEAELPQLSEETKKAAEEETRVMREEATQRQREQALRRLNEAPRAALEIMHMHDATVADPAEVIDRTHHELVQVINGDRHRNLFRVDRYRNLGMGDIFLFQGNTTVGVPDLLTSSGVIYYEVEMNGLPVMFLMPRIQFGYSLANGMEVTDVYSEIGVGNNIKSWGFCGLTGHKIHVDRFDDEISSSKWGPGKVIGIAANVDKGMIAISVDGDWKLVNGNGVKFEDEAIKTGVYPCISGIRWGAEVRFGEFKYGKPPDELWDIWPKYEDSTWLDITEEAREAAIVLGYTQQSWMSSSSSNPIESKMWGQLTNDEQAAAHTLGFNSDIWAQFTTLWKDKGDSDDDTDEAESSDGSVEDDDDSSDDASHSPFMSLNWNDLPGDARLAAETLGYTQPTWDDDADGPLDDKNWDDLTPEQHRAAIVLGYDKDSWNEDCDSDSSDSYSSTSTIDLESISLRREPRHSM
ncbi:hypothetical protein ACHAXR_011395 [Thalassiosira sp. AJA248-18]